MHVTTRPLHTAIIECWAGNMSCPTNRALRTVPGRSVTRCNISTTKIDQTDGVVQMASALMLVFLDQVSVSNS